MANRIRIWKSNSITARIDKELDDTLREFSKKNELSYRQCSKIAARLLKKNIGRKTTYEIKF